MNRTTNQDLVELAEPRPPSIGVPAVELVIPVHDEEADLEPSLLRLHQYPPPRRRAGQAVLDDAQRLMPASVA